MKLPVQVPTTNESSHRRRCGASRAGLALALSLALGALATGCKLAQTAIDVPGKTVRAVTPGKKDKPAVDPVEVQERLLRFADEFATRMILGVDKLAEGSNALSPAEVLKWKIALAGETCTIASGPNATADLLDMTVFVTVTRIAIEEHWQPKIFGESARPLLESCRQAEQEVWLLTSAVLTPAQQTELREAIAAWHAKNPFPENVLAARALGFAAEAARANKSGPGALDSVFNLIKVDPLSGMEPALREVAQTRLLAERALYITQHLPMIVRWQTELLSANALAQPEVRQLIANSTQISASVERFAGVAEKLPSQISTEREEILKALNAQETTLTPLVNEVRQTITAGTGLSTSLNTTLITLDALMKRFGVGETNNAKPPATNAEPFRIQDYTQAVLQLEAAARQITELLRTLDQTVSSTNLAKLTAQVAPAVQQAQAGGKEVVDYAFWKGVLLVLILLVAALVYRFLTARLTPAKLPKANSP